MLLSYFRTEFDRATNRVFVWLDPESANAILANRNLFEPAAVRSMWNWLGNGNWLPGYKDYHGRAAGQDADSYSSFMTKNYTLAWDFRPNGLAIDMQGVPTSAVLWPHRYDTGLYTAFANGRDSWSADFRSWMVSW